ncbi:MAG TPA: tRNA (cytidine(34)-2'-O)-methyltransferase [Phycisphaerales bacterium]|nr:tRNA (cytidine(34)-2'-O)-methyltransferase [Phycisphaerales bacterium]
MGAPLFHVVLHQPLIPNNTGNIGRTCVATGCALHLIHPLGFSTGEKALRRAGLDYWPRLAPLEHAGWDQYVAGPGAPRWFFTARAARPLWDADLVPGDHLVFGNEVAGLPGDLLAAHADRLVSLPMLPGERSLNLATAVCAVVYEGIRQAVARARVTLDARGRLLVGPADR